MYTIAVVMALSAAPETPQFNGYFRDLFGGSCQGRESERRGNCHSTCHGGLFHGGVRDFFSGLGGRGCCGGGCCGGCNGSAPRERERDPIPPRDRDNSYDRGAMIPRAPAPQSSCIGGAMIANGSCFGGMVAAGGCTGGLGAYGQPYSIPQPFGYAQPIEASYPMAGNCDCGPAGSLQPSMGLPSLGMPYGGGLEGYPSIENPNVPMPGYAQPKEAPGIEVERQGSTRNKIPLNEKPESNRGTVVVNIPSDAKLFVEGRAMKVTNGERSFVTPPLPTDREAVYSFKIEFTRDGETITQSKKVNIRAGATTKVEFTDAMAKGIRTSDKPPENLPPLNAKSTAKPAPAVDVPTVVPPALDHAKITVTLPKGATLYVNGTKNDRKELVREFTTPTLTPGKKYQYVMKAELIRDGLPEYQEQNIEFRAGDNLTLDFSSLAEERKVAK